MVALGHCSSKISLGRQRLDGGVIINGWPSIVIALPLLIVLIIVGIILPVDILRFLIALLPGGFISYWLFNRAITIMPYIAYKK
jgi:hypothetical protein